MNISVKVSVVIATYNRGAMLRLCIEAVRKELVDIEYEVIVIDGGSSDATLPWLVTQKDIITIVQHNHGEFSGKTLIRKPWAYFINLGFKVATGEYIVMLSDDSLIRPGAITNGVRLFDAKRALGGKVGGVAFYFRDYPVRKKFAVAINLGNLYINHGIFLNSAVKEVGFFDENYNFYFADTDMALMLKQYGYSILISESSFVEHYYEATPDLRAKNNDSKKEQDRLRLIEKWCGVAYPSERRVQFLKVVGYWEEHPTASSEPTNEIKKLMAAQSNDESI